VGKINNMKNFIDKSVELGVSYSMLYKMILRKEVEFLFICGKYYFKNESNGKNI